MPDFIKEARRDQSRFEIERLFNELNCWLKRRKDKDQDENGKYRGQYDSQLQSVFDAVNGAARIIHDDMAGVNLSILSRGEAYAKCTQYDQLIVWLWRVFDYFREKFDQRDDPVFQQALCAADEVLWSCYKPFFQKPSMAKRQEPAPLPYIETEFSPLAIRKDQGPGYLDKKIKFGPLENYLKQMPLAVMRLPTIIVTSPWSLVLIGHEAGHFIQPLVEPGFGYATLFAEALEKAIGEAEGSEDDQSNWFAWAPEIFADWYSVLMMGPWAVWVMAQFEMKDRAAMWEARTNYPPPIVRLELMAKLADSYVPGEGAKVLKQLGLDEEIADARAAVRDMKFTDKVCAAIKEPLPYKLGLFDDLLNFRAQEFQVTDNNPLKDGEVAQWSRALQGKAAKKDDRDLRTARLIVAGAAKAWSEIMQSNDTKLREDSAKKVNQETVVRVLKNGEKGKRAVTLKDRARKQDYGAELAKILLAADASQLRIE